MTAPGIAPVIAIVDTGSGNLFSIARALAHVGASVDVTDDAAAIRHANGIVLPGVGAFADAMAALGHKGLVAPLRAAAAAGTPVLGICLGMQLLFDTSHEFGRCGGLGLIGGAVRKLPARDGGMRIPNVGWRALDQVQPDPLLAGHGADDMFYFVHSYVPFPEDRRAIVATVPINGLAAAVMVRHDDVVGCQFHPEKSGPVGLALLRRYVGTIGLRKARTRAA